jgi:signal transduction histidine kinase
MSHLTSVSPRLQAMSMSDLRSVAYRWESRAELSASRARAVAAADEVRRRLQRDVREGPEQRLANAVLALKLARRELGDAPEHAADLVDDAIAHAEDASRELRELSHDILPAALSRGGLRDALDALVSRVRLPVTVEVTNRRLPEPLEVTAYLIIAEALTNAVKHADADSAHVVAVLEGDALRLAVRDDGIGGAHGNGGGGLLELRDRAAAVNGQLGVHSPRGHGTEVTAILPVAAERAA